MKRPSTVLLLLSLLFGLSLRSHADALVVGSKKFAESNVLGEIAVRVLGKAGFKTEHKEDLGNTGIVWTALKTGSITLYPEYTGTVGEEILKVKGEMTPDAMRAALRPFGVGMTGELGFNDTYALVMRQTDADRLNIHKISDLKSHPELRIAITHEFQARHDGWQPLTARYGLNMQNVQGIEHGLAYVSLNSGKIDLTDAYSTDAEIGEYHLVALQDDLNFFPQYKAIFLYRLDMPAKAVAALHTLEGTIDETSMVRMNVEAKRSKDYTEAASLYFGGKGGVGNGRIWQEIAVRTGEHLTLVGVSLFAAILVGVPLGILAGRPGSFGKSILSLTGIIQTIPSLALLALLIPLFGVSKLTAILALFLYSLLPIVRNTATGLQDIPGPMRKSAEALGLEPDARMRKVYLPMASRTILAGIKTSAIINVGTATLAAFIGAGGLGELIVKGLSLNDNDTLLQGAIPAALLALLVQGLFDLLDTALIPKGLRLQEVKA